MSGFVALLFGFGILLSTWKFSLLFQDWNHASWLTLIAVGIALFCFGAYQIHKAFSVSGAQQHGPMQGSRHGRRFTRPGLMYLLVMSVLFVASLLGRSNLLMFVYSLMAGPFVVNGWVSFSMLRRTVIRRQTPQHAMAGEPFAVTVSLGNGRRLLSSWLMTVTDRISSGTEHLVAHVLFSRVPPGTERSARYQMRLMKRGKYVFGPIYVTTSFPLGLVQRGLLLDESDEMLVYPRLGRLSSSWRKEQSTAAQLAEREESRAGGFDDEFHHIREYRSGDNPRAIHWRTSARRNELMVREFHESRDHDLVLLLDLWLPDAPESVHYERVELAVSFTATLGVDHMRESRDSKISVVVAGSNFATWTGQSSTANANSLLEVLAVAQAGRSADRQRLLNEPIAKQSPNAKVLLITTRQQNDESTVGDDHRTREVRATDNGGEIRTIRAGHDEIAKYFYLLD